MTWKVNSSFFGTEQRTSFPEPLKSLSELTQEVNKKSGPLEKTNLSSGLDDSQATRFSFDRIREWGRTHDQKDESAAGTPADVALPSASVSCILKATEGNSPEMLLLQREILERDPWSGQISFPGGRSKNGETPLQTAKREAREETEIDLDKCEIVARLETVLPGNLSIRVTPFLVIAPQDAKVAIDHQEIVDFFWVPLEFFAEEKNEQTYTFSRLGQTIRTPSFVIAGSHVVWGMTLRIILNLVSGLGQ